MTITLRTSKGSALTWAELDGNFTDLDGRVTTLETAGAGVHGALTGLDADDHTQYHNDARAVLWLATRSTDDLPASATKLYMTSAERTKLSGIEANATADQTDVEIETAYNNQVAQVSAGEIAAGTQTAVRRFSPADIVSLISAHETGGGGSNISVDDEGSQVVATLTKLNFVGAGVTATDAGSGEVTVTIPGGGGGTTDHGSLTGLTDDDHTQYHNVTRANTWLGTKTTDDVAQGATNLYQAQQISGPEAIAGTETALRAFSPADVRGMILIHAPGGGGVTDHGALTGLGDDDHSQYHTDARAVTWLATRSTDDLPASATNLYMTSAQNTKLNSLDSELGNLTTAEIQQLQNIGATTISASQWAGLGAGDQVLAQASNVIFAQVSTDSLREKTANGGVKTRNQNFDSSAGNAMDFADGNVATYTVTGNTTFTIANPPASGQLGLMRLYLTNGGLGTLTWPASFNWDGGSAPTFNSSGTDIVSIETIDGGTTYRAALAWAA